MRGRPPKRPGRWSGMRSDGIVIARSHRASKDARRSTGYGDAAIQSRPSGPSSPGLLRFAGNDEPGSTQSHRALMRRLRLGKGPCAVQDLRLRAIKADQIVPPRRGRQTIGDRALAAAELDRERPVLGRLCNQVVERIGALRIGDEMALVVVDADRPEA